MKRTNAKRSEVTVGCLFAAIGGFCRAFRQRGATVLWANEVDRFARDTFVANYPDVRHIWKPVEELNVDGDVLEPVDVLTAGFPCQPFSEAGEKRGLKDERGLLFLEIVRLIREFGARKPKLLLLENVRYFRNHDNGRTFKRVQSEIQRCGYWFPEANAQVLDTATHTGIPQNRKRVFMVALNTACFSNSTFTFPPPLPAQKLRDPRTFLDLKTKAPPEYYFAEASQYHPMFVEAMDAGDPSAFYQLRRSYVRESKHGRCFTLMANMGDGGHNQPVVRDRWGIRKLTVRECARLQGYEDNWFKIPSHLSKSQALKQIGNSVTVPLVERIAEACMEALAEGRAGESRRAKVNGRAR